MSHTDALADLFLHFNEHGWNLSSLAEVTTGFAKVACIYCTLGKQKAQLCLYWIELHCREVSVFLVIIDKTSGQRVFSVFHICFLALLMLCDYTFPLKNASMSRISLWHYYTICCKLYAAQDRLNQCNECDLFYTHSWFRLKCIIP